MNICCFAPENSGGFLFVKEFEPNMHEKNPA